MSYFDDASLVMIPSGYKASKVYSVKPTDGTGDLTFTRSNDTATRVGPDGLIEKVRTNLLTYSNTFSDASWVKTSATITANDAVSPEGVANASKYEGTNATNALTKTTTLANGLYTFSIYVKRIATDNFRMNFSDGATGEIRYVFNLSDETSTTTKSGGSISDFVTGFESLPNGWYRLRISAKTNAGSAVVTYFEADNEVGSFYVFGSQLETGDIATDYIATTSAAVSVGPVANVPRLDYLGSSCPRLLLEPQRSNVFLNSESASAQTQTGTVTINSNSATSPSGYQDADQITADTSAYLRQTITTVSGQSFAFSVFLKNVNAITSSLFVRNTATAARFDITWAAGVPTLTNLGPTATAKAVDYGNGWYRIEIVAAAVETSTIFRIYPSVEATSGSVLFWGAQVETNVSYPSSYVNTLGAAVTRGADSASKTGISSLIGQTEGTLYWEGVRPEGANDTSAVSLSDTTTNNEVTFRFTAVDTVEFYLRSGGVQTVASTYTGADLNQNTKIAFAYKANDVAVYVNGTLVVLDTSATVPASLTAFKFSRGNDGTPMIASVNQALLFKTRLSNSSLAELTSL